MNQVGLTTMEKVKNVLGLIKVMGNAHVTGTPQTLMTQVKYMLQQSRKR